MSYSPAPHLFPIAMDGPMSLDNSKCLIADPAMMTQPSSTTTWMLVGVCGAGMHSLCSLLLSNPHIRVVGTDSDDDSLMRLQRKFGERFVAIPWSATIRPGAISTIQQAAHSLAISPSSPPLAALASHGITSQPLPEALRSLLGHQRQICIAGTHGKSTTTAMISWILRQSGKPAPTFLGAEWQGNEAVISNCVCDDIAASELAVIESCEYRNTFLSYSPSVAVVTSVESDHFDWFMSESEQTAAFQKFVHRIPSNGCLVINGDSPVAKAISTSGSCRVVEFTSGDSDSLSDKVNSKAGNHGAHWYVTDVQQPEILDVEATTAIQTPFRQGFILRHGQESLPVTLGQPGVHNCENATAAILATMAVGIIPQQAAECLRSFPGIRRRFEYRGNWRGIHWIDDYAHHPGAIRATLETARQVFRGHRLIAVFEPHQLSRTAALFSEFCDALSLADEALVLPVLPARENATTAICLKTSGQLVRQINHDRIRAFLMTNLDQVQGRLDHSARPGDVVITMGAGRTHQIHDENYRRLQRDFAA